MYVKAFAAQQGVTVQAVYKLIRKHTDQLQGHVEVGKDGKYLDDFAMEYLRGRMQSNSQIEVYDDSKDLEINALNEKLAEMQRRLDKKDDMIDRLQQRFDDKVVQIEQLEMSLKLIEDSQGEQIQQAVAAAEEALKQKLEQEHLEDLQEKTGEFQRIRGEQNTKIGELRQEIDQKDKLIAEYRTRIEAELKKTKWQRFKELWKKEKDDGADLFFTEV